jgi:uncharacterized membrane protein YgcG
LKDNNKEAVMKYSIRKLTTACMAMLLGICLVNEAVAEVQGAGNVPLKTMNQSEYEIYRQQLDRQVKGTTSNTTKQLSPAVVNEEVPVAESETEATDTRGGYGKGYRARMERSSSAARAGGYRGGSTSRGGGGRNH